MDIPLPRDPRHQRFADLFLAGNSLVDAYLQAGFKCARTSALANAKRIRKRADVEAYILAIQAKSAEGSVLSVAEKRAFFARIVRTPITALNPENPDSENNDLIRKWVRKYSTEGDKDDPERFCTETLEKLDPLKAIDLDNRLSGDDPEASSINQLAAAIASLGSATVLPTETM